MSLELTFDSTLSRVRLTAKLDVLMRYTFSSTVEGWGTPNGGTLTRVATPSEDGNGALQYTPPGAVATVNVQLTPGFLSMFSTSTNHVISMRVRSSAGHADVVACIDWHDVNGTYLSTSGLGAPVNVPAGTWTTVTSAALSPPVGAVKMRPRLRLGSTPAASNIFNVDWVQITFTRPAPATPATFQRSKNGVYWTTVRGGSSVVPTSNVATLDDYEFVPGQVNYYRVTSGSDTYSATITPAQTGVWFKSITRPFLNRLMKVTAHSDITRPARIGVFEVIGRSVPVAVSDVRGSRRWTMTVKADTVPDADAIELVFASGDILYIQTDGTYDIPGGYVIVGDVTRRRLGTISSRRYFDLDLIEVAAPGADVVGVTSSWETLLAQYGSWTAVLSAFGSWAAVADYVASPSVVIVA